MMLSTKARRVSVGARAGNARRSALRRGCGERFRTWAGRAWPIARGRGPGKPGTHARGAGARPEGSRDADARKFGPEGRFADARGPAFSAWLGPANGTAAGLGDRRCVSGSAYALGLPCSGEPGKLETPMPEGSLRPGAGDARPRGDPLGPKVGSTPGGSGRELLPRPGEGRRPEIRLRERPAPLGAFEMRLPNTPQPPARKPSGEKFRPAPSPGPADRGKQRREPPAFRAARGRPRQCFKALTPGSLPLPRGWGPRTALPQDSATGAAAPGMPTRWACPVPGNRESSPDGSGAKPGGTRDAYPRGSKCRRRGSSSGEPQPEGGPEGVQTDPKTPEQHSLPRDFPKAQHPALNPRPRQAVSRQRPQEARREKKRTKQSCSVRLPDCYSAAFCAASARASASLARASASFRFAAASFSFASAS